MPVGLRSPSREALAPDATYTPPPSAPDAPVRTELSAAEHAPSGRDLVVIGLTTLAVRIALFVAATQIAGWSLTTFANLHDGPSYLRVAAGMLDPSAVVAHIDRRVFIGYPTLIALLGLAGVPLTIAALGVSWLSSGAAAVLSALLFRDRRIGWAMAIVPPSFLTYSTLAMSEASLLALVAVGMYCVVRRDALVAGALALGFAGLVRPVACFAVLALLAAFAYRRQWRKAIVVALITAAVVAVGFGSLRVWRGDALEGVKIYANNKHTFGGQLLAWPFESLIMTPLRSSVPLWKIGYVWAYVAAVCGGCLLAVRALRRPASARARDESLVAAVWLIANTLFVLSMGSVWGFHYFDRHILAALPPLLWAYQVYYPRRIGVWVVSGALSASLGLSGLLASVV